MIEHRMVRGADGKFVKTTREVPDEELLNDPQYQRAKTMAEGKPGSLVIGVKTTDVEREDYLEDLQ